jgi:4-hydroxy-2-oxoheptanedioate aldolase
MQDILANPVKRALREGRLQVGLWAAIADPIAAEIAAGAGFDWMLLDAEHAPNDLRSILAQIQVLAAYPTHPVVRPRSDDPNVLKQLLDVGVQTFLIPMIETAAQAERVSRAVRYPPAGTRGVGSGLARASRWTRIPDYLKRADEEICVIVQVESREGLRNLDAIATTPGVDAVFIGAADLAADFGYLGHAGHPEVTEALADAAARLRELSKPLGLLTVVESQAQAAIENGCAFIAVGVDSIVLAAGLDRLARAFNRPERPADR